MGYNTDFDGHFTISPELREEHYALLKLWHEEDNWKEPHPKSYCQWEPTIDRTSLAYDGGEKFYDYVEWLKYLIETHLAPWGYTVSGEVTWQGEDVNDRGKIHVRDNRVIAINQETVQKRVGEQIEKVTKLLKRVEGYDKYIDPNYGYRSTFQELVGLLHQECGILAGYVATLEDK